MSKYKLKILIKKLKEGDHQLDIEQYGASLEWL